jgi:adenylate cyclase
MEVAPRLAIHFERGRDDARAVTYLAAAAAGARQRFAHREAIGYFEAALAIVGLGPEDDERRRRELELRLGLGVLLSEAHGFASEQVRLNYERASELCARVGTPAQRLNVLYARWYVHIARAERKETLAVAAELRGLARHRRTAADRILTDSLMVRTLLYDGKFLDADRWMQRRLVRRARATTAGQPTGYGPDPLLAAVTHHAIALWFLGYPERAQTSTDSAVLRARESGHPFTLAAVLTQSALVHLLCRSPAQGGDQAEESMSLSAQHGFAFWHALSSVLSGWALVQDGRVSDGSGVIERALSAMSATGAIFFSTYAHAFLAEGRMRAGLSVDALNAVDAGLTLAHSTLDRAYEPELWRLKGALLLGQRPPGETPARPGNTRRNSRALMTGGRRPAPDAAEAERYLRRALTLARASQAKSLELRAATSMARVWEARGRPADARRLLAGICAWFGARTGGADLAEARALLGQLRK